MILFLQRRRCAVLGRTLNKRLDARALAYPDNACAKAKLSTALRINLELCDTLHYDADITFNWSKP